MKLYETTRRFALINKCVSTARLSPQYGYDQQIYLFGQIQIDQTGGRPYSNTSPYEVTEGSLHENVFTYSESLPISAFSFEY